MGTLQVAGKRAAEKLPGTQAAAGSGGEGGGTAPRWLLLIHRLPPKPDYLRVKVRRKLQRLGAVALKNSVYALPKSDATTEDFQWLLREIVAAAGDAVLCEASLVEGVTDAELEAAFRRERDADFTEIAGAAARLVREIEPTPAGASTPPAELSRLRARFDELVAIDYFGAPKQGAARAALEAAEARHRQASSAAAAPHGAHDRPIGRTWVTREGVHVDRIASAWLIRRFIDPAARFKFVAPRGYRPSEGELRFDMFEAEHTHEGARCTFETLLHRFALDDAALAAVGEVVHDVDFKEALYARPETSGVAAVVDGIVATTPGDDARLARGADLLDGLYAALSSRRADA